MTRRLLLLILILSLFCNLFLILVAQLDTKEHLAWPFPEIGPGIMQDSYHDQAPVLESPYGMIGDAPGGYSFYAGSPIQSNANLNLSAMIDSRISWALPAVTLNPRMVLLAALIAAIPLLVVTAIGRKSYGTAKTR